MEYDLFRNNVQQVTGQIIDTVMAGLSPEVLETRTVAYTCTCSKARVERALVSLGRDELRRLARDHPDFEFSPPHYEVS